MRSIGIVFKKDEMTLVSLRDGLSEVYLEGYRIIPFMDLKGKDREDAILKNLERFLKTHKGASDNIFIALPRDAALIQFINLPMAVEENLRKSLEYEMDRHTPFSPDEIYFDYQIIRRIPESSLLHLMLITVKKDQVDYYINLLKKIKIQPRNIEITTTALFNAFQDTITPAEKLFDLSWLKNNKTLTERYLKGIIKKSPKIAGFFKERKEEKRTPSTDILIEYLDNNKYELNLVNENTLYYSKPFNTSEETLETHFKNIHDNGLKSIIHLPSEKNGEKETKFILSGKEMGKDYTKHAPEKIKSSFSILNSFRIRPDKNSREAAAAVLPILTVPIGLALKGLKSVAADVNLVPPGQRLKKNRSKRKIIAAAVPILIFVLAVYIIINSINRTKLREAALDKELNELKLKAKKVEKLRDETERIEKSSIAVNIIKEADLSKIKFLEELTLIIPMDGWLSDFSYNASGEKIKLSGYAVSASKLIPILEESKLFENVKFTSPITTDKRSGKEKFRIEMAVSPGKSKK